MYTKVVSLAEYRQKREQERKAQQPRRHTVGVIADEANDRFIFQDEPIPEDVFPPPRA